MRPGFTGRTRESNLPLHPAPILKYSVEQCENDAIFYTISRIGAGEQHEGHEEKTGNLADDVMLNLFQNLQPLTLPQINTDKTNNLSF